MVLHLPGYMEVQRLVALAAQFWLPNGGILADYGAGTGRSVEMIRQAVPSRTFTAHLFDSESSMLAQAKRRLGPGVETHLRTFPAQGGSPLDGQAADLSLALWLLQFIRPRHHRQTLAEIRAGSADAGVLLVATKTRHLEGRWHEFAGAALDDYKAERGVTAEERALKSLALRGAMFPLDVESLRADLLSTGWQSPEVLWRWHEWVVIGAFAADSKSDIRGGCS